MSYSVQTQEGIVADRRIAAIFNTDALVANNKSRENGVPPKIFHRGITPQQLQELTGCVRKSDSSEFWHHVSSLKAWFGEMVVFVLDDGGAKPVKVIRFIDSIVEKPATDINADDLKGTLAEIAMRETGMTFLDFFRQAHGGRDKAMVIRVHAPRD